jgi:hypothetical protein
MPEVVWRHLDGKEPVREQQIADAGLWHEPTERRRLGRGQQMRARRNRGPFEQPLSQRNSTACGFDDAARFNDTAVVLEDELRADG